ncbi:MAG TPA: efflux RND transporter permease subunit [Verrucomicrobiales bacterium]|nr:efflux RND transporter permease subunit [Verrucomicrobiales bacterium]
MNIAEASIRYKTISLVMTALIIVGGFYSYLNLGRLEDPEFTIKSAQVVTMYPGATAQEVADEVTDAIETAVQQLGQIDLVKSISEPGRSIVLVDIKDKYDKNSLPQVWDELRRKVTDVQSQLPPGASPSIVNDDYGDVFGVYLALFGDGYSYADLFEYAKTLRRELLMVQDVGKITIMGDQQERVYVEISRARLAQLGISPELIYNTLSGQNQIRSGGRVKVGDQYIRIQPSGEFSSIEDIGNLQILQNDGTATKLRLKDIAQIKRGYVDPPRSIVHFNGRRAVALGISTVSGGNVVTMGNALSRRAAELQEKMPIGIEVGVISLQSAAVIISINAVVISLAEALAIVVGILMFAMGFRSGILIGVILLLTVLATFIVMLIKGVMLERISLGALIIALGMLVDNAIVVVEGILVNLQRGMGRVKAASQIVGQTIMPLFGATVVAILAFAAIGVSQDSTGEFCRSLFQVILYSLLLSWVLAVTITPVLGVMFLKVNVPESDDKKHSNVDPYGGALFQMYKGLLVFSMKWRWSTLLVLVGMLVLAFMGFGSVKKSFFPPSTRPQFMIHYWLPQGTHISRTEQDLLAVSKYLQSLEMKEKGITDVTGIVGQGAMRFLLTYTPEDPNSAYGLLLVGVDDYRKIDELREEIQDYMNRNFADSQSFSRKFVLGPGDPSKIQMRISGPDSEQLRKFSAAIQQELRNEPDLTDILSDWRQRVPLVRPIIAETQARNAGITRAQIAASLQRTFEGVQVGLYRETDELLPIIIRSPEEEGNDVSNWRYTQIWSPVAGKSIPLSQLVIRNELQTENSIIRRRNRVPTLTVKCDPRVGEASAVLAVIMPKIESKFEQLKSGWNLGGEYTLEWGGEYEDSGDAQASLVGKIPPIGVLVFLTVVILFNSLRQPLIIFLTVPLAIIGVTLGLLVMDQPFGFMALLGFMSLVGMLIKNAIVLIDEINIQIDSGKESFTAIVDSGMSRVRPVSMAALTTVLGMVPLLTDAFFAAMAVTIMFGLAFATVLTLVVVPVLYAILFKIPSPEPR